MYPKMPPDDFIRDNLAAVQRDYADRVPSVYAEGRRENENHTTTPRISDHIEACHQGMGELEQIVQECINRSIGEDPRNSPTSALDGPKVSPGGVDNMTRASMLHQRIVAAIHALNVVRESL